MSLLFIRTQIRGTAHGDDRISDPVPANNCGLLVVIRKTKPRNIIVCVGSAAIAIASIALVVMNIGTTGTYFTFQSDIVNYACLGISVLISIVVICFGVKYKNIPALALAIVQLAGSLVYEFYFAHDLMCYKALYIDSLSLIMALIIGIIGTGICVYSIGYMHDFYFGIHHPDTEQPNRRPTFFALMFVFLSAMYGIIFFNNLIWLFTGLGSNHALFLLANRIYQN